MVLFLKPYVNFQNYQDSDTESVDSISIGMAWTVNLFLFFIALSIIRQPHLTWYAHSCSMSKLIYNHS